MKKKPLTNKEIFDMVRKVAMEYAQTGNSENYIKSILKNRTKSIYNTNKGEGK